MTVSDKKRFNRLIDNYFATRKNKRNGRDAVSYEMSWVANTVRFMRAIDNRTFRINHNFAFLTSVPRWREIFATEFRGRLADHLLCDTISKYSETVLSDRTFNNRKGKGSHAAIQCVINDIREVTNCYNEPARIIKLDFKNFFPNALWSHAEKCIHDVIDLISEERKDEYLNKDFLKWLATVLIHADPVRHFERRTPEYMWKLHIDDGKSIITKPHGVGAAIGRLVWQSAMGLYINDDIKWLNNDCVLKTTCFVDDITIVIPERLHSYVLSLIPIFRKRLYIKNVILNERKFYDQPYENGFEFLGSHIKPLRLHLNNKTYKRAKYAINNLNIEKYKDIDKMLAVFNSYCGLLKNRTDYGRILILRDIVSRKWWQFLKWNNNKLCLGYKNGYGVNERLNYKYHLKLKQYERRNN